MACPIEWWPRMRMKRAMYCEEKLGVSAPSAFRPPEAVTYEEGERCSIVTSTLGLQDVSNVCRYVLLCELSLSHDRGGEDRIGGRNASGDDEGGKELEPGDDGVHEGGGDHPTEEHAAIWEKERRCQA